MKKLICLISLLISLSLCSQNRVPRDSILAVVYKAYNYLQENKLDQALETAQKSVTLAETAEDNETLATAYNALGNVYNALEKKEQAEQFFLKALAIAERLDIYEDMSSAINGLSNIYADHYDDPDKGMAYLETMIVYNKQHKDTIGEVISQLNLLQMALEHDRMAKSSSYLRAMDNAYDNYNEFIRKRDPKYDYPLYRLTYYDIKGNYYTYKKDYKKALQNFDKADSIATANDYYNYLLDISNSKLSIYDALGDTAGSRQSLENKFTYLEKLTEQQNDQKIAEIETKYQVAQKEKDLETLAIEKEVAVKLSDSKSTIITVTIISICLLLLLLGALVYSFRKQRGHLRLQLENQKLLKDREHTAYFTQLKSRFLARLSHEIRTPLHGITGITSILKEDGYIVKNHSGLMNALKFSGDHLVKLVDSLIQLRQIENKDIQLNLTEVDVRGTVRNIVNTFKFQAQENGNEIKLKTDLSVASSYLVDDVRLSEIVINLVENAVKFTRNGKITVSIAAKEISSSKDALTFTVKDTGKGISKENLGLIFDKFDQGEPKENIQEGPGLGLAKVKYLLELVDSHIHVESELGKGSAFSFTITLKRGVEKTVIAPSATATKSKKILIVEDNKLSKMILLKMIELLGHHCDGVENGKEAVQAAQDERYDLILMDLNMPIKDGFEATEEIKKLKPHQRIIALTATDISKVYDRCIALGMEDALNKPIDKERLSLVIEKHSRNNGVQKVHS